jgi:hypothetical protein
MLGRASPEAKKRRFKAPIQSNPSPLFYLVEKGVGMKGPGIVPTFSIKNVGESVYWKECQLILGRLQGLFW